MNLLAKGMTHGQAVALTLLCVFLIIFIVVDIYLVLFLRRKNKKLAKNADLVEDNKNDETDTKSDEQSE